MQSTENPRDVLGLGILLQFNEVTVHFVEVFITLDKKLFDYVIHLLIPMYPHDSSVGGIITAL